MNPIDELFGGPTYDHPKLRLWAGRIEAGELALVHVRRTWDGITRSRPELVIEFYMAGKRVAEDSVQWEYGLNSVLVAKKVRARTLFEEAERLSLSLQTRFEPLNRRYNDDYFNSVLIEYMRDVEMVTAEIEELMAEITAYPPHQSGNRDDCRDDIKAILATSASECVHLGYTRQEAVDLLIAALAEYLDDRFSVTSRRKLGWAKSSPGFWTSVASLAPNFPGAQPQAVWTATSADVATFLRSLNLNTTSVTVERELLCHASDDPTFPWKVTFDIPARRLVFTPKA